MILHPAVCVHGRAQAEHALRIAVGLHRPVTLISAAGAAGYAGCGWWHALVAGAKAAIPTADCNDVLDCGDAAGRAMEALRHGCRAIILCPTTLAFAAVQGTAAQLGVYLIENRPPCLDLADPSGAHRLSGWLAPAWAGIDTSDAADG